MIVFISSPTHCCLYLQIVPPSPWSLLTALEQKNKWPQYTHKLPGLPGEKNSLFFLHKVGSEMESCCRYLLSHFYKDEYTFTRLMGRKTLWLWLLIIPGYLFKHVLWLFYKLPAGDWRVFRRQDNPGLGCLKLQHRFGWQVGVSQSRVHGRKNTGLSFICS